MFRYLLCCGAAEDVVYPYHKRWTKKERDQMRAVRSEYRQAAAAAAAAAAARGRTEDEPDEQRARRANTRRRAADEDAARAPRTLLTIEDGPEADLPPADAPESSSTAATRTGSPNNPFAEDTATPALTTTSNAEDASYTTTKRVVVREETTTVVRRPTAAGNAAPGAASTEPDAGPQDPLAESATDRVVARRAEEPVLASETALTRHTQARRDAKGLAVFPTDERIATPSEADIPMTLRSVDAQGARPAFAFACMDQFLASLDFNEWATAFTEPAPDVRLSLSAQRIVQLLCNAQLEERLRTRQGWTWQYRDREHVTPLAIVLHELKLWTRDRLRTFKPWLPAAGEEILSRMEYVRALRRCGNVWRTPARFTAGLSPATHLAIMQTLGSVYGELEASYKVCVVAVSQRRTREKLKALMEGLRNVLFTSMRVASSLFSFGYSLSDVRSPRFNPTALAASNLADVMDIDFTNLVNVSLFPLVSDPLFVEVLGGKPATSDKQIKEALNSWRVGANFYVKAGTGEPLVDPPLTSARAHDLPRLPAAYISAYKTLEASLPASLRDIEKLRDPTEARRALLVSVGSADAADRLIEAVTRLLGTYQPLVACIAVVEAFYDLAGTGGDLAVLGLLHGETKRLVAECDATLLATFRAEQALWTAFADCSAALEMQLDDLRRSEAEAAARASGDPFVVRAAVKMGAATVELAQTIAKGVDSMFSISKSWKKWNRFFRNVTERMVTRLGAGTQPVQQAFSGAPAAGSVIVGANRAASAAPSEAEAPAHATSSNGAIIPATSSTGAIVPATSSNGAIVPATSTLPAATARPPEEATHLIFTIQANAEPVWVMNTRLAELEMQPSTVRAMRAAVRSCKELARDVAQSRTLEKMLADIQTKTKILSALLDAVCTSAEDRRIKDEHAREEDYEIARRAIKDADAWVQARALVEAATSAPKEAAPAQEDLATSHVAEKLRAALELMRKRKDRPLQIQVLDALADVAEASGKDAELEDRLGQMLRLHLRIAATTSNVPFEFLVNCVWRLEHASTTGPVDFLALAKEGSDDSATRYNAQVDTFKARYFAMSSAALEWAQDPAHRKCDCTESLLALARGSTQANELEYQDATRNCALAHVALLQQLRGLAAPQDRRNFVVRRHPHVYHSFESAPTTRFDALVALELATTKQEFDKALEYFEKGSRGGAAGSAAAGEQAPHGEEDAPPHGSRGGAAGSAAAGEQQDEDAPPGSAKEGGSPPASEESSVERSELKFARGIAVERFLEIRDAAAHSTSLSTFVQDVHHLAGEADVDKEDFINLEWRVVRELVSDALQHFGGGNGGVRDERPPLTKDEVNATMGAWAQLSPRTYARAAALFARDLEPMSVDAYANAMQAAAAFGQERDVIDLLRMAASRLGDELRAQLWDGPKLREDVNVVGHYTTAEFRVERLREAALNARDGQLDRGSSEVDLVLDEEVDVHVVAARALLVQGRFDDAISLVENAASRLGLGELTKSPALTRVAAEAYEKSGEAAFNDNDLETKAVWEPRLLRAHQLYMAADDARAALPCVVALCNHLAQTAVNEDDLKLHGEPALTYFKREILDRYRDQPDAREHQKVYDRLVHAALLEDEAAAEGDGDGDLDDPEVADRLFKTWFGGGQRTPFELPDADEAKRARFIALIGHARAETARAQRAKADSAKQRDFYLSAAEALYTAGELIGSVPNGDRKRVQSWHKSVDAFKLGARDARSRALYLQRVSVMRVHDYTEFGDAWREVAVLAKIEEGEALLGQVPGDVDTARGALKLFLEAYAMANLGSSEEIRPLRARAMLGAARSSKRANMESEARFREAARLFRAVRDDAGAREAEREAKMGVYT